MTTTTQRRVLTPTWHPLHLTADEARTLRAEEREEALRAAPKAASSHVALVPPYVPAKPLTMTYRVVRAVARMVAWTGIAGVAVVGAWALIVLVAG